VDRVHGFGFLAGNRAAAGARADAGAKGQSARREDESVTPNASLAPA
jgi:hypothetical protein